MKNRHYNQRGGVMAWTAISMLAVIAIISFALEMFRIGTALVQQQDSAQFAAEAALSDIRKCLIQDRWSSALCLDRANKVAAGIIARNKLMGGIAAQGSGVVSAGFYLCSLCPNGVTESCATSFTSGSTVMLTDETTRLNTVPRMARVTLQSSSFTPLIKIVSQISMMIGRGNGAVYYGRAIPAANATSRINYVTFSRISTCS